MSYLRRFWSAANGKWTTWFALILTGLATLPDVIPAQWANIEGILPTSFPTERVHHILLGAGALAVIWLRVRREVKAP